jgi:hypothetical protein
VSIVHTPTREMIADFFTKPISGQQFAVLRSKILNE